MQAPVTNAQPPTRELRKWLARRANGARLHAGVDLGSAASIVVAPESALVVVARRARRPRDVANGIGHPASWDGYGPAVVVLLGDSGWYHVLAHLDAPPHLFTEGRRVEEGQALGRVRQLGHVHWETRARLRPPVGRAVIEVCADPFSVLAGSPVLWRPELGVPQRPEQSWRTPGPARPRPLPVLEVDLPTPRPTNARPS